MARRRMLPGSAATVLRWMFSVSMLILLPRALTRPCIGRNEPKPPWKSGVLAFREGQSGCQGRDKHTLPRQQEESICQPLFSVPGSLVEAESSSVCLPFPGKLPVSSRSFLSSWGIWQQNLSALQEVLSSSSSVP